MYYGIFDPINVVFHVLLWILLIWFVVWLIRGGRRYRRFHHMHGMWCDGMNCDHPAHSMSAMNLLKERYVKGEISKEEFEEKKKALME